MPRTTAENKGGCVSCATNHGGDDLDYYYSSARFYESGVDEFGFLNNIFEIFDG